MYERNYDFISNSLCDNFIRQYFFICKGFFILGFLNIFTHNESFVFYNINCFSGYEGTYYMGLAFDIIQCASKHDYLWGKNRMHFFNKYLT